MDAIKGGNGVDTVSYADASIGMNIRLDVPLFSADPNSPILTGAAKQITARTAQSNKTRCSVSRTWSARTSTT